MIVKVKKYPPYEKYEDSNLYYLDMTKEYKVISIVSPDYILVDELGGLAGYPMLFFDILDNSMDDDWGISVENYGDGEYDISILIQSEELEELEEFSYCEFFEDELYKKDFFISYLKKRNIILKTNLAYTPHYCREYYHELLAKIDKQDNI